MGRHRSKGCGGWNLFGAGSSPVRFANSKGVGEGLSYGDPAGRKEGTYLPPASRGETGPVTGGSRRAGQGRRYNRHAG
jgi:hypothetical protein